MAEADQKRCPVCGNGVFVDVTFREGDPEGADEPIQTARTRQVETFSCGHEVVGPALARSADATGELEVERRETEETVDPL